jgi:hypothetical protein
VAAAAALAAADDADARSTRRTRGGGGCFVFRAVEGGESATTEVDDGWSSVTPSVASRTRATVVDVPSSSPPSASASARALPHPSSESGASEADGASAAAAAAAAAPGEEETPEVAAMPSAAAAASRDSEVVFSCMVSFACASLMTGWDTDRANKKTHERLDFHLAPGLLRSVSVVRRHLSFTVLRSPLCRFSWLCRCRTALAALGPGLLGRNPSSSCRSLCAFDQSFACLAPSCDSPCPVLRRPVGCCRRASHSHAPRTQHAATHSTHQAQTRKTSEGNSSRRIPPLLSLDIGSTPDPLAVCCLSVSVCFFLFVRRSVLLVGHAYCTPAHAELPERKHTASPQPQPAAPMPSYPKCYARKIF